MNKEIVGKQLKKARTEKNLSQEEQSQKERQRNIEAGEFELSDTIYEQINNLLNE